METKTDLHDDTLDALQELIAINIDSAEGLNEAAAATDDETVTSVFQRVGGARRTHAVELQQYVKANDETPEDDGSLLGTAHRKWLSFRAAINGGDPKVVLIEAERAEDVIKGKYEKLLVETAGSAMNDVLHRQYAEVKKHHDLIRDLRDAA